MEYYIKADSVKIEISGDGQYVWVFVNGRCKLRVRGIGGIKDIGIMDLRAKSKRMDVHTGLEGMYAVPNENPVTCANPGPWLIDGAKIEKSQNKWTVFIRNTGSVWFRLDQCFVGSEAECRFAGIPE